MHLYLTHHKGRWCLCLSLLSWTPWYQVLFLCPWLITWPKQLIGLSISWKKKRLHSSQQPSYLKDNYMDTYSYRLLFCCSIVADMFPLSARKHNCGRLPLMSQLEERCCLCDRGVTPHTVLFRTFTIVNVSWLIGLVAELIIRRLCFCCKALHFFIQFDW